MKMFSISKKQSVFNFQAQGYINVYIYIYTWICEANKLSTTEYFDQPVKWFEYEVKLRSTWTSQRGGLWVTSTTMCVKSSEVVLWKISRARRVWVMFCTSQWRVLENDYCFSLHASQVVCELLFCLFIRQVKYLDGEWYKCQIIVAGICGPTSSSVISRERSFSRCLGRLLGACISLGPRVLVLHSRVDGFNYSELVFEQ